jgi:hypothetical protein
MVQLQPFSWDRMIRAVEKVRQRAIIASSALDAAGIESAIIGAKAVEYWVATVDPAGIRNTPNVDLLISRSDFASAITALAGAGFRHLPSQRLETFLDAESVSPRDGLHLVCSGEKVNGADLFPTPDVSDSVVGHAFRVIGLAALVRMKLTAWRTIDKVHLRDLLDVGVIDQSWTKQIPEELAARLQELIDDPTG